MLTFVIVKRSYKENFHGLRLVISISTRMADTTIGSELMIVNEGGNTDGCENSKWKKCIDSTDHVKTSYVVILGGKDVLGDDYDIDSRCDFVKALLF